MPSLSSGGENLEQLSENPALDCGIDRCDGLIVAFLPKLDSVLEEHACLDDCTLFSQDGVAIDMHPSGKWWLVKYAARGKGLDIIQPVWHGQAMDFRRSTALELLANRQNHDGKLHMRAYSRGPWISLDDMEAVYGH